MIYSSNTENEDVYYVVCYQCWDKQRIWEKKEFDDMFEITKILSMFMKSSHIITEREKFLQNKVDNDAYGVFTLSKFEEEVGRITRNAHVTNKKSDLCILILTDFMSLTVFTVVKRVTEF